MDRRIKQIAITTIALFLLEFTVIGQHAKSQVKPRKNANHSIQFIFTSDVHFGLNKENFRTKMNVPSVDVNAAMIQQMNRLPGMVLPADGGVNAGRPIKNIDAIMITGDIANREEKGIQPATVSWAQFKKDYQGLLKLKTATNKPIALLVTPGNHDASNAIGFHRPMQPFKDPSAMIGIYNMEMHPAIKKNSSNYDYRTGKIHYAVNIGGIHCMFVNLWPDSAERAWMQSDLKKIKNSTSVLLFTHSMPDVEARFFINPNGKHDVNSTDKFENLVSENFKDGSLVTNEAIREKEALASFLQLHPNIKAWFHGHTNFTEYYDWNGPDKNIALHCFRADSPMKGKYSAKDETQLSFEVISIDTKTQMLTARECLWNSDPLHPEKLPVWGKSISVSLQ